MVSETETGNVILRSGKSAGELIETRVDGKEKVYYSTTKTVYWTCERLQVCKRIDNVNESKLKTTTFVTGLVRFDQESDLSLFGADQYTTKTVTLVFNSNDQLDLSEAAKADSALLGLFEPLGLCTMCFNKADWEIVGNDEWWMEVNVHSAILQELVDAISNGTLTETKLGIRLDNLFSNEAQSMPWASREQRLFLRPRQSDNNAFYPEPASGYLVLFRFDLSDWQSKGGRSANSENEFLSPSDQDAILSTEIQASNSNSTPQLIAGQIAALRRTIGRIGVAIVIALILLMLK